MKKLLKLGIFAGVAVALVKFAAARGKEWQGLTEPEVRAKLDGKLGAKVPPEKLEKIQDTVVDKMRARGKLAEGPAGSDDSA